MSVHSQIQAVTDRIAKRSELPRRDYLDQLERQKEQGVMRGTLSCGNLAHGFAACSPHDKAMLAGGTTANLAIITSYNDMLSAHQPYETYPAMIKQAALDMGATAQVAGGVPAMCDGVTQGQKGMDLSLFSRDVIAMSTAISLSHNMFDAAVFLGICDKIVPGMLIGALSFGHLPAVFIPAGPMMSGLPNDEKAKVRQLYMEGKVGRAELLEAESKSYHSPGTCTFYGTANSNQMLMEIMGLHLPGSSFVNPGTPLRDALTKQATKQALSLTALGNDYTPVGHVINEKTIVNGMVGLHATGGSTNHTLHLVAIAAAAGLHVTWQDMSDLSDVVPLLARVYPNGLADVNHFHAAGGMGFLMRELISGGYLHQDVKTVFGTDLSGYTVEATYHNETLGFAPAPEKSGQPKVLTGVNAPFAPTGGLKLLKGNLGNSVIKISAVKPEHRLVEAPARVFHSQTGLQEAFKAGELDGDMIAVIRFSGPKAIGMPELHKLTPLLGIMQDRGITAAAPILFESFDRLEPQAVPLAKPPTGVLFASNSQLPTPLKRFRHPNDKLVSRKPPPEIAFPRDGVVMDLGLGAGVAAALMVKVRNGVPPFAYFANGAPFELADFARQKSWRPDGTGYVRLSVVDAEGQSDAVTVFVE